MEDQEDEFESPLQLPSGVLSFIQFVSNTDPDLGCISSSSPLQEPITTELIISPALSTMFESQTETSNSNHGQHLLKRTMEFDPVSSDDTLEFLKKKPSPAYPKPLYKDLPFILFTITVSALTTTALLLTRPTMIESDAQLSDATESLDYDVTNRCLRALRYHFLGIEAFRLQPTAPEWLATEWLAVEEGSCKSLEINSTFMEQRYALLSMFFEMGGLEWGALHGWANEPNIPECDWDNVECNELNLVSKLDLGDSTLVVGGHLLKEIGRLSSLTSLNLEVGSIQGTIPSEIYALTNLKHLNLKSNLLVGSLHSSIGNLRALTSLDLSDNQITGVMPSELKSLVNLKKLYVESNAFSGFPWSHIVFWPDIEEAQASFCVNQVETIPSEIGELSMLKRLQVTNTCAIGGIPTEIGRLSYLNSFIFSNNPDLNGTIPSEIGQCTSLENLNIRSTKVSGSLPSEIGQLMNLNGIYAYGSSLEGTIPVELENVSSLQDFDVGGNLAMSGTVPTWFCALNLFVPCQLSCSCCDSICC